MSKFLFHIDVKHFIQNSYWPYETDLEKQMHISVCMTIVHLFKKRYLVIIFSFSLLYTKLKHFTFFLDVEVGVNTSYCSKSHCQHLSHITSSVVCKQFDGPVR